MSGWPARGATAGGGAVMEANVGAPPDRPGGGGALNKDCVVWGATMQVNGDMTLTANTDAS